MTIEEAAVAYPVLQYFVYAHLPAYLQAISKPFAELAAAEASRVSFNRAETAAGLRKLLEAKDCFVRAALPPKKD